MAERTARLIVSERVSEPLQVEFPMRRRMHLVPAGTLGRLLLAILFAGISMFPLLYMVSLSFQPIGQILTFPPILLPVHPTWQNYVQAWTENSFAQYFFNSLYVSFGTVLLSVLVSVLTAFGFARYKFSGRNVLFYFLLSSLAVPSILLIMPQYMLMKDLGLLNSRVGLVLLYTAGNIPFNVFLLRNFFQAIPKDLEDSMRLDGTSEAGLLVHLIAPLSIPALVSVSMFTFNGAWDEFIIALTMINSPARRTLPIALAMFQNEHTTAWGALFAATTIATVPQILVFAITQRWFQEGMSVSVPT